MVKLYSSSDRKAEWAARKTLPKPKSGSRQSRQLRELLNRTRRAPRR